jgi:acyl-CoA thioester hydrolase
MARHRYECRVRFSDVDIYGHVNNVKYFEYYQEARLSFMTELGRGDDGGRFGLVVARLDVDYKRPIMFRSEPYLVESWVTRIGESSFGLAAEIKDGEVVLSKAEAVMVTFDLGSQRSRALSPVEREQLSSVLEG